MRAHIHTLNFNFLFLKETNTETFCTGEYSIQKTAMRKESQTMALKKSIKGERPFAYPNPRAQIVDNRIRLT